MPTVEDCGREPHRCCWCIGAFGLLASLRVTLNRSGARGSWFASVASGSGTIVGRPNGSGFVAGVHVWGRFRPFELRIVEEPWACGSGPSEHRQEGHVSPFQQFAKNNVWSRKPNSVSACTRYPISGILLRPERGNPNRYRNQMSQAERWKQLRGRFPGRQRQGRSGHRPRRKAARTGNRTGGTDLTTPEGGAPGRRDLGSAHAGFGRRGTPEGTGVSLGSHRTHRRWQHRRSSWTRQPKGERERH